MLNSTEAFLKPLEHWVKAMRQDDFSRARECAEQLIRDGALLAHHPEFRRCFTAQCGGFEPQQALHHLCQFLLCATEGRCIVLKQFTGDPEAKPPN